MKNPALALYIKVFKKIPSSENARHAKRGWKKRAVPFSFSNSILALSIMFLFLPLFVIVVFSFNSAKDTVWSGFSFVWYQKLVFSSKPLWQALLNSLIVAITSGIVATVLGTLAAIGVSWYKFLGKSYIQTVSFLPMVLPEVIMGISLLIFFSGIKMSLGLFTIFIAHTTFCLDLGANEIQTLTKVVIPAIMPGIISGFMMSITMSLEDYVITALVSGPGSSTLPLYVYSMIRFGVSPVINALSFVLILIITAVAVLLKNRLKSFAAAH